MRLVVDVYLGITAIVFDSDEERALLVENITNMEPGHMVLSVAPTDLVTQRQQDAFAQQCVPLSGDDTSG